MAGLTQGQAETLLVIWIGSAKPGNIPRCLN